MIRLGCPPFPVTVANEDNEGLLESPIRDIKKKTVGDWNPGQGDNPND